MIIIGIIDIQVGTSPRIMEEKLIKCLNASEKKNYLKEEKVELDVGVELG